MKLTATKRKNRVVCSNEELITVGVNKAKIFPILKKTTKTGNCVVWMVINTGIKNTETRSIRAVGHLAVQGADWTRWHLLL